MYIDIQLVNTRGDEVHYTQYALLSEVDDDVYDEEENSEEVADDE